MKRFAALVLSLALPFTLSLPTAAFADPIDEALSHGAYDYDLQEGAYIEGRVLLLVDESAPMALSASSTSKELFALSEPVAKTESGDLVLCDEDDACGGRGSAISLLGTEGDDPSSDEDPVEELAGSAHVVMVDDDAKTTAELIDEYADAPGVLFASPDYLYESDALSDAYDDPMIDDQWFLDDASEEGSAAGIDVEAAWSEGVDGGGPNAGGSSDQPVVAVFDTGVDYTHPDLAASMWTGGKEIAESLGLPTDGETEYGYDAYANVTGDLDEDGYGPMDAEEHGTHVAGIIAAQRGNAEGGSGVAPQAKIMAVKIGGEGTGMPLSATLLGYNYVQTARSAGVDVVAINNSWGGYSSSSLYGLVADYLYGQGVLSIKSAGNSSVDHDANVTDDVESKTNIVVDAGTETGGLAGFSDYGAASTDVVAPGTDMLSTVPEEHGICDLADGDNVASAGSIAYIDRFDGGAGGLDLSARVDSDGLDAPATLVEGDGSLTWSMHLSPVGGSSTLELSQNAGAAAIPREAIDSTKAFAFQVKASSPQMSGGFVLNAYAKGTDGGWVDLGTLGALDIDRYALIASIDQAQKERIDWDDLTLLIKRSATEASEGYDLTVTVEAVALASHIDGYAFLDGTSMAAPVISGAVALLCQAYPDESVEEMRARIVGGAEHSGALEGVSQSDGRFDLDKALYDPNPVVADVVQDAVDPSSAQVTGFFFGDDPVVEIDGASARVTGSVENENGSQTLSVVLPDSLAAGEHYAKVVSDGGRGNWGRLLVPLSAADGAEESYFETLSFPSDISQLDGIPEGMEIERVDVLAAPSEVAAIGEKLYIAVAGYYLRSDEDLMYYPCVLSYDTRTGDWAVDAAASLIPSSGSCFALATDGTVLFCLGSDAFWMYDPASGSLEREDLQESLEDVCSIPEGQQIIAVSVQEADGQLLVSGVSYYSEAESCYVMSPATAVVDVQTGSVSRGADLQQAGICSRMQLAGGTLIVSPGALFDGNGIASTVTELQVYDSSSRAWNTAASLPVDLAESQNMFSACVTAGGTAIVTGLRANAADDAGAVPDTYLYDAESGAWSVSKVRLSPYKLIAPAGTVADDGYMYVLALDSAHGSGGYVFKRAKVSDILGDSSDEGGSDDSQGKPDGGAGQGGSDVEGDGDSDGTGQSGPDDDVQGDGGDASGQPADDGVDATGVGTLLDASDPVPVGALSVVAAASAALVIAAAMLAVRRRGR